jgi:chromosome segregation ATPase
LSDLLEAGLRPSGQRGADLLKNVDDVKTLRSRLDKSEARVQELEDELGALRLQYSEAERAADVRGAALAAQAEAYLSVIKATARAGTATGTPVMPLERAA